MSGEDEIGDVLLPLPEPDLWAEPHDDGSWTAWCQCGDEEANFRGVTEGRAYFALGWAARDSLETADPWLAGLWMAANVGMSDSEDEDGADEDEDA
jgi:hypothetical protein